MTMRKFLPISLLALALGGATLSAHHSFAMFEMDKDVTYKGKVTEWKWQNPHVHFTIHVAGGAGVAPETVGTWDVEGGSVNIMGRQGWTRASVQSRRRGDARRTPHEGRVQGHLPLLRGQG